MTSLREEPNGIHARRVTCVGVDALFGYVVGLVPRSFDGLVALGVDPRPALVVPLGLAVEDRRHTLPALVAALRRRLGEVLAARGGRRGLYLSHRLLILLRLPHQLLPSLRLPHEWRPGTQVVVRRWVAVLDTLAAVLPLSLLENVGGSLCRLLHGTHTTLPRYAVVRRVGCGTDAVEGVVLPVECEVGQVVRLQVTRQVVAMTRIQLVHLVRVHRSL
mmetsp:Transcript_29866/g.74230  ORF Transcript_29866/g.74230 Transcript_29866/m.74230 type:complete len:218 (+) Transcript_29866:1015-1668(+)